MLKFLLCFFVFLCSTTAFTQFKVTLIAQISGSNNTATYFLAGNNNGWNPADPKKQFSFLKEQEYIIQLADVPASFEFKVTKGSWESVECTATGAPIANRKLLLTKDTTVTIMVENFQSGKNLPVKKSTASPQVKIINSFFLKKLNAYRRIWIYLPADYDGKKRFPVLYMHDGQNLFDEATAFKNEWGVDEYLDSARKKCIVVGIDNGGDKRMSEYNFYPNKIEPQPTGKAYGQFIVQELIPYINKHYQTKTGRSHTFIAGSSMGGLISFFIGMEYPKTFGKVGVFSPSFWINFEEVKNTISRVKKIKRQDYYLYAGMQESEKLVQEVDTIYTLFLSKIRNASIVNTSYSLGKHDEESWHKQLPAFFEWLLDTR